jgi:hypothetical protein
MCRKEIRGRCHFFAHLGVAFGNHGGLATGRPAPVRLVNASVPSFPLPSSAR